MYTVYEHVNKINGKRYIGITKRKPEERWGKDGSNYSSTPHFYSAINKYGWDNFEHNILFENLTEQEACDIEKELIKKHKTQNKEYGYNILEGGNTATIPDEVRGKMSKAMMGNKNGLGHPCSEEKKKKIRDAQIGKKLTDEHRAALSEAAKKRHVPCSDKKKEILSLNYPHQKPVYCYETNIVYRSVQFCARELGLHPSLVSKVCKNKLKSTGGFHLRYA